MFVDEVKVSLIAGNGGSGCVSFRRAKYEPMGGPNGGDGGNGGNIILKCDDNINHLGAFSYKSQWKAENGEPGRGRDQYGKKGKDCILKVPPGSIIQDIETGKKITELVKSQQEVVLLKGGKGGLGNIHYKSSINQSPRQSTPGTEGQKREFKIVLKTIADIGLVGFPNAGKSSLTRLLTKAHPKAAAYPFTTLHPHVGVIEFDKNYERLLIADIPGLIEGAHLDKGLGHKFLRHIERCRVLLFIIDMSGSDGREPLEDYQQLYNELLLYNKELVKKPKMIAVNKMDLSESVENLKNFKNEINHPINEISCLSNDGLNELKEKIYSFVKAETAE